MDHSIKLLKVEEMAKLAIYYVSMVQGKQPSRKTDIIKFAMNKQSKDFPMVIKKVEKDLRRLFGAKLIGLKNGPKDGVPVACNILEATFFITINIYRQRLIAEAVPTPTFHTDLVKAVLLLILSTTYMMERPLEEDAIWQILVEMEFAKHLPLCKGRDDFKRFLETHYVGLLYLTKYETKTNEQSESEQVIVRYGWGIRAELEFDKYAVLKFVAQSFNKKPEEFVDHFAKISIEDRRKIDEEDERFESSNECEEDGKAESDNDESKHAIPRGKPEVFKTPVAGPSSRNSRNLRSKKDKSESNDDSSDST